MKQQGPASAKGGRSAWTLGLVLLVVVALSLGLSYGLCLQDDTYISFRYARNLVEGNGLVYNPGEAVEGYTNFLWTVIVAGWLRLGLDPVLPTVLLALAGGVAMVLLAAVLGRDLASPGGLRQPSTEPLPVLPPLVAPLLVAPLLVAPLLVATDAGLALEAVQGLESTAYAALVSGALWLRLREGRPGSDAGGRRGARPWVGLLCGLSALTRPEGYLIFALIEGIPLLHWLVMCQPASQPGSHPRSLRTFLRQRAQPWLAFLALTLPHLAFRLAYYGQPVPNTFYAKVGGSSTQVLRGLSYIAAFAAAHIVLSSLALVGAWSLLRHHRDQLRTWLMVGLTAAVLAYVAVVGGDFKVTWRFILPVLVPLAVLAQLGVVELAGWLRRSGPQGVAWTAVIVMLAAVTLDTLRLIPKTRTSATQRVADLQDGRLLGSWLRASVPPDTVTAIHAAGIVPWFSGLPTIDMWGLSDPHIAHRSVDHMGSGMAGHEKTDYDYVFAKNPDLYLPYDGYVTDQPVQLMIPADFPPDFESRYRQYSITLEPGRVLNLYARVDQPLPWAR